MKKKLIIVFTICIVIGGYLLYNQLNPRYVVVNADRDYQVQSLDELESYAEVIVKVKVLDGSKSHIVKRVHNLPCLGYTLTPVKVIKSYKGLDKTDAKELEILEAYWSYTNVLGEKIIQCIENYRPLKTGNTYILFLRYNSKGKLIPACVEYGKYALNSKTLDYENIENISASDLEIGQADELYGDIFKNVSKKYQE